MTPTDTLREVRPNPGSDAAVALGCTCPVIDNRHGKGAYDRPGMFWFTDGCPVHAPRLDATVRGEEG